MIVLKFQIIRQKNTEMFTFYKKKTKSKIFMLTVTMYDTEEVLKKPYKNKVVSNEETINGAKVVNLEKPH